MKHSIHSHLLSFFFVLIGVQATTAAPVIVNEYNAVREGRWLDEDGQTASTASDSFFGRVESNGGDWFEMVVVGDGTSGSTVDMRGWSIEISDGDEGDSKVVLTNDSFWEAVPAGTILTFTQEDTAGGGLDTEIDKENERTTEGWAWSNIHVGDATYVDDGSSGLPLTTANKDTQITIKDSTNATVFGPAGEGVHGVSGVSSREVLELQESPSLGITEASAAYEGTTESTFGAPNTWDGGASVQSFLAFRTLGPAPIFTVTQDDTRILAGATFSLDVTASDDNDGDLTITAPTLPSWLTLTDNGDGTALLEGTPTIADVDTHPVALEVADDPSDGTDSLEFSIRVFPSPSAVILNEYNADNSWLELVVVGDGTAGSTVDLRGWTIEMEDDGSSQIVLSDDAYWESVQAGTILLFSADDASGDGFDTDPSVRDFLENAGYATAHFWVADEDDTYLDAATNGTLNVSNDAAMVAIFDGNGDPVFGPAGEGIFSNGGVNGSERFALQDDPSPGISPFSSNFSDSDEASPGRPNATGIESFQSFEAFATGEYNPAPFFTWEPTDRLDFMTVATTGSDEYLAFVSSTDPEPGDTLTVTILDGPSWLRVENFSNGDDDLIGDPEPGDEGAYVITLEVSDGTLASTLTFTLYVFNETSPVLVNEFNAVADDKFLKGGDEAADDDGGTASDGFFGRVEGNGGDWFELVVVGDGSGGSAVDLRGWTIEISDDGGEPESIVLSENTYWSNVRAGTILTFTEDGFDAGGLDTGIHRINRFDDDSSDGGWAWTNILVTDSDYVDQAASDFGGGFAISNDDTRISLRDADDNLRFGPVGEEFIDSGVGSTEIFKLEQDPATSVNPLDATYNDGSSSTFGAPNIWSAGSTTQDFNGFYSETEVNSVPYFTFQSPRFARQGEAFSFAVTGDDFDGTSGLEISLTSGPAWLSVADNNDGTATLEGTPTAGDIGLQDATLSISDGTDSAAKSFRIYVHPATATVILNEYNAVASDRFLNGGDASADDDSGTASDPVFARAEGNGGDWFELVVVGDGSPGTVDLRGWTIEIADNAAFPFAAGDTIVLSQDLFWEAVPTGMILTFTEKRTAEGGYDTALNALDNLATEGWAWSNIWIGDGSLIDYTDAETNGYDFDPDTGEVSGVGISHEDTQFVLRDADGDLVFGPVGEGVAPESGISSTEIFELEADPSPTVSPLLASTDGPPALDGYDDGSSGSTFGRPNDRTGGTETQDFSAFLPVGGGTSDLEDYLTGFGLSGADLLATADSDNDGATQIEEFAFGSNPTLGGSLPDFRESIQESGAANYLTLTFLRRSGGSGTGATYSADGITYEVQGSLDLSGWSEAVESTTNPAGLPTPPENYEWVTYRLAQPIEVDGATDRGFLRVSVSETAEP